MTRTFLITLFLMSGFTSSVLGDNTRTIHVQGYDEIKVDPDSARVEMAVTIVDKDVLKAKKEVDKTMSAVLDVAKKLEIAQDEVTATQLRVNAQYSYDNGKNELIGYEATRGITVTLRKLTQLDELLNACIQAGVNQVDEIELVTSKEKELKAQVLTLAIANAKEKAGILAAGFDAKVGKVQTVSAERGAFAMSLSAPIEGLSADTYKPGKIKIVAELDVVFQLD